MTEHLFRSEVLAAQEKSWLGEISLAQPVALWVLSAGAFAAACLVVSFLFLGEYTPRVHATGKLISNVGWHTLHSVESGVVSRMFALEGDQVRSGEALGCLTEANTAPSPNRLCGHDAVIAAPVDGLVSVALVAVGDSVSAGQPLLRILPADAHLQAQLIVSPQTLRFIRIGNTVSLRYPSFPYQRFGVHSGKVVGISQASSSVAGENPLMTGAQLYRVLIDIDRDDIGSPDHPAPLRADMELEADIPLETQKLYQWLSRPES